MSTNRGPKPFIISGEDVSALAGGATVKELATKNNKTVATFYGAMKRQGIAATHRSQGRRPNGERCAEIKKFQAEGLSVKDIATRLGITHQRVYQLIRKINGSETKPDTTAPETITLPGEINS